MRRNFEFFLFASERGRKELYVKQRDEHLKKIAQQERGSGPREALLDAWCEYIRWARQALLNGGNHNEFSTILNDCIRKLSTKELLGEFRDNYEFTRVCVEFIDYCDQPLPFVQWMERHRIGVAFAKYWLAKARVLEDACKNTAGAAEALAEGIKRRASPLEKLKAEQRQLEARVAARMQTGAEVEEEAPTNRKALSALASSRPVAGLGDAVGSAAAPRRYQQENARKQVLAVEGRDDGGAADRSDDWTDFGSQREAVKENADVARQWSKAKLPQKHSVTAAAESTRPGWRVLEDGQEEDDDLVAPVPAAAVAAKRSNSKLSAAVESKPATTAAPKPSRASFQPPAPLDVKRERPVWNQDALDGEWLSFEELRAAKWLSANAARLERAERERAAAEEQQRQRKSAPAPAKKAAATPKRVADLEESVALDTYNYEALVRNAAKTTNLMDGLDNVFADTVDVRGVRPKSLRPGGPANPTINTRMVMDEVERMFAKSFALDDSAALLPTTSVAPAPAAAAVRARAAPVFEVYEEDDDSLKSFRDSMSQSALVAAAMPRSVPAAPKPKAAAPAFEVFEDDADHGDQEPAVSFAVAVAPGIGNNKSAGNTGHISFLPMSPIAEERQSNSDGSLSGNHGPVVLDNPWLKLTAVPTGRLASCHGFVDHGTKTNQLDDSKYLELDDGGVYDLSHQIGGGLESNVYRSEDVDNLDGEAVFALKITKPPSAWEFYLHRQLERRCSGTEMQSFGCVVSYHRFANKGMMFSVYREFGTLEGLLELWPGNVPEEVVAFYAAELLRVVELLHSKRVIHNDLTLDNILLKLRGRERQDACAHVSLTVYFS